MKLRCMAGILMLLLTAPLAALAAGGNTIYRHIESTGDPIPFAIHLPPDFDAQSSYPVLIGPGDAEEGADPGFYWQTDPHIKGWVIVDARIWDSGGSDSLDALLDAIVPNGEHVMTNLIGAPFIQELEKLR